MHVHLMIELEDRYLRFYLKAFANDQAFKNAIAGESGSIMEIVNGTSKTIQYQPIRFHSTTWAVLLMKNDKQ
jgi:hypothetical protein